MTDDEVNRIIAKFMGYKVLEVDAFDIKIHNAEKSLVSFIALYTKSLDELVSVWERLDFRHHDFNRNQDSSSMWEFNVGTDGDGNAWYAEAASLQQAAATATAKAIQEIGEA